MDESENTSWEYKGDPAQDASYSGGDVADRRHNRPGQSHEDITWQASEYISHDRGPSWLFGFIVASVALAAIVYAASDDIFASAVVLIVSISAIVFALRKPRVQEFAITATGIRVGQKSYDYESFRSFSVVEEGAIDSIWLKPLKRLSPSVVMYFDPADEERIISTLSEYLPHEERELDAIDRASRRLKL